VPPIALPSSVNDHTIVVSPCESVLLPLQAPAKLDGGRGFCAGGGVGAVGGAAVGGIDASRHANAAMLIKSAAAIDLVAREQRISTRATGL
jgi:hypothetical protein